MSTRPPGDPNLRAAIYIDLVNEHLDHLPVEAKEDFGTIASVLETYLNTGEVETENPGLKGRVTELKVMIDEPELYAKGPADQKRFQETVRNRVAAKVEEFKNKPDSEKEKYIANQKKQREEGRKAQEEMSKRKAPKSGTEAHSVTEEEWHREQQMRVARERQPSPVEIELFEIVRDWRSTLGRSEIGREGGLDHISNEKFLTILTSTTDPDDIKAKNELINMLLTFLRPFSEEVTEEKLRSLSPTAQMVMIFHSPNYGFLLRKGISFNSLSELDPEVQQMLVASPFEILQCLDRGISFELLAAYFSKIASLDKEDLSRHERELSPLAILTLPQAIMDGGETLENTLILLDESVENICSGDLQ